MSTNATLRSLAATERVSRRALVERRVLNNRYAIEYAIASGGMSRVFAARDLLLDRTVAIKVLLHANPDSADMERLRREASALAAVESPHVVPIFDIGIEGSEMYLVMQRVRGITLADEVERHGPVALVRACRIAREILVGVSALHRGGLVHRDLKPANVILDRDDRAIVLDLGIALHRRRRPLTPPGMATGTPEFMAPEQRDSSPVDSRTDLYQLGRILIYLLTGVSTDGDIESVLHSVPPELALVLRRSLAPIGDRFTSCAEYLSALDGALGCISENEQRLVSGPRDGVTDDAPRRPRRARSKWPALVIEDDQASVRRESSVSV